MLSMGLLGMPVGGAGAQDTPGTGSVSPSYTDVLLALREVGLPLEQIQVRTTLKTETGGSALLQLADGTLIDVQLAPATSTWTVRNFYFVAGDASRFTDWTRPWRQRVESAGRFLAAVPPTMFTDGRSRSPEELAPLVWFEDPDESTRLWGMNPVTFRVMQALRMVPMGPMDQGRIGNPMPRRR